MTPVSTILRDFDRLCNEARDMLGSSTDLWACTVKMLNSMRKTEHGNYTDNTKTVSALRFMVVFTDGENTGDSTTLEQMVSEVRAPGFGNFSYIGIVVGAERMADQMRAAFKVRPPAGYYAASLSTPAPAANPVGTLACGQRHQRRMLRRHLLQAATVNAWVNLLCLRAGLRSTKAACDDSPARVKATRFRISPSIQSGLNGLHIKLLGSSRRPGASAAWARIPGWKPRALVLTN